MSKPITALNLRQCWKMVNRCDTHEKIQTAIQWLDQANISIDDYNDLMDALACISRELYNPRW